jgi:hypothetical protein
MRRGKTAAVTVVTAIGFTLAACGTGAAPTPPPPSPSTVGTASTPLPSGTLARIDADLGTVHDDITQATTDLTDPKPDS